MSYHYCCSVTPSIREVHSFWRVYEVEKQRGKESFRQHYTYCITVIHVWLHGRYVRRSPSSVCKYNIDFTMLYYVNHWYILHITPVLRCILVVSTGLGAGKPHLTPSSPYYYSTRQLQSRITGIAVVVGS